MAFDDILYILHCVRIFAAAVENLSTAPGCCYRRLLLVSTSLKSRPLSSTVLPGRFNSPDRICWMI